ncbi:MAG: M48 family metallopeptidase [Chitinophagaceae bacterium]|nr:M48 family metallopeptidase [Rubrivivax sp.]
MPAGSAPARPTPPTPLPRPTRPTPWAAGAACTPEGCSAACWPPAAPDCWPCQRWPSKGSRPRPTSPRFSKLVPAEQVEAAAAQQYAQMLRQAQQQNALGPAGHPQVQRLRAISERIIPHALGWNSRARQWRWEVNLLGSEQVNAFCMPGGKIAFYSGILSKLQLSDHEVATIMGHEVAHALREHARERMGKTAATRVGAGVLSALLGLGSAGDTLLNMGGQLLTLRFSREDETEADLVGMDLAARAGYDPRAGVTLWQKMMSASQGAPPEFLSTHPAGDSRIREIQAKLPKVQPLYDRASKPPRMYGPPG